jgi:hypothetical protein
MIWYDIFVNCSCVITRWQYYSTHLHTDSTKNDTINNRTTHITTNLEEPCPVFANFTLAFALQLRKKHGKTSVRVRKTLVKVIKPQSGYSTHTTKTPTHYKTHTHTPKHTLTHTPTQTYTRPHTRDKLYVYLLCRPGDRIPLRARFSVPVHTGPVVHPASWTTGSGFNSRRVKRPGSDFDYPPHLAPKLKKE